jgi:hypothetical protein
MHDEDAGPGDPEKFSADDLERLYRLGGNDPAVRIQGKTLNQILNTKKYVNSAWYVVTSDGVERI